MTDWISRVVPGAPLDGELAGLTFGIKDNIDLAGVPTTAADPRNTTPATTSAYVVQRLVSSGAVPLGKTNLDQYATGLVGTRSPYGASPSVFSPAHVSGGSSSGSAAVVARGEVDFALGTDTAGSGRVPAAFNGLVGIKPTRGLVSTRGVFPACRSLDCVTVLARDTTTARRVFDVMADFDPVDPFARRLRRAKPVAHPRIGVPAVLPGLGDMPAGAWAEALGLAANLGDVVPVDVAPLLAAAELLYEGPWLAERWLAFGDRLVDDPAVDPVVREVVGRATGLNAAGVFAGFHRLAELAREIEPIWDAVDGLLLPVAPHHPTFDEVAADPIGVNTELGRYTNMTNLLDLCSIAFPGPMRADGLPFGVQLLGPAGHDDVLIDLAARWAGEPSAPPPTDDVLLAVAGAHLSGQPLNHDLVRRGAALAFEARMASGYRMFVVDGALPRPGLTRTNGSAAEEPIEVEVWRLPAAELGGFLTTIAPPLAIGDVELADGSHVLGFVCTADAADPSREITSYGGWRAYLAAIG